MAKTYTLTLSGKHINMIADALNDKYFYDKEWRDLARLIMIQVDKQGGTDRIGIEEATVEPENQNPR